MAITLTLQPCRQGDQARELWKKKKGGGPDYTASDIYQPIQWKDGPSGPKEKKKGNRWEDEGGQQAGTVSVN